MKRAIVVEDDAHNATLFRKLLEKRLGFTVTVTEQPAEVLAAIAAGGVDLVVMDVSLRRSEWDGRAVNGVELCRLLKSDPATVGVPVLLATAHAMRGDEERLLAESGADRYVSKPIVDHEAFVATVRELLREAA
jgi:two-component system cell cycle response regulator DivK